MAVFNQRPNLYSSPFYPLTILGHLVRYFQIHRTLLVIYFKEKLVGKIDKEKVQLKLLNYYNRFQPSQERQAVLLLILYILVATIIGFQQYLLDAYNNFTIFKDSVFHLVNHQNLYLEYPNEYFDVFLYNPSFSVLFIPFAYLQTGLGVVAWTITITTTYFWGIRSLKLSRNKELFFLLLILPELITSVENMQNNPIIAAFIVLSVTTLEKNKIKQASIYPAINFFIKGYGGIASVFFVLKSPRIKTLLYLFVSFAAFFSLPLIFYSFSEFVILYKQWLWSLKEDYSINVGISLMGLIKSLLYSEISVRGTQLIGIGFFLITFSVIYYRKNYEHIKFIFLSYVLIWVIIFNHSAESPTYIIASTGVFIWYLKSNKSRLNVSLFLFFFIITVMSPNDLFPEYIRENYVNPYSLKALPCVLIWIKIQFDLLFPKTSLKSSARK